MVDDMGLQRSPEGMCCAHRSVEGSHGKDPVGVDGVHGTDTDLPESADDDGREVGREIIHHDEGACLLSCRINPRPWPIFVSTNGT